MKPIIIYMSIHKGNTEKIARAMAKALKARIAKANEISLKELKKYDLIGLGSGIYAGRHHKKLLNLIGKASEFNKDVFIFSTAGMPLLNRIWHAALRNRLKKKDCNILGEFCCPGYDTIGPFRLIGGINKKRPNRKDLERAREFARNL